MKVFKKSKMAGWSSTELWKLEQFMVENIMLYNLPLPHTNLDIISLVWFYLAWYKKDKMDGSLSKEDINLQKVFRKLHQRN